MAVLHPVIACDAKYRGYLGRNSWALCIGAGISRGLSPTWLDLTVQLINEAFGTKMTALETEKMVAASGWSLDGWIQAAANEFVRRGKTHDEFVELLESILYSTIRAKAIGTKFEKYLTRVLNFPDSAPKDRVIEICDFLESAFAGSSLLALGQFLVRAAESGRAPKAVITFNADTFLETYIDLFLRRAHYTGPGPHGHPKFYYTSIIRPGTQAPAEIPIYHCHGTITPNYNSGKRPYDARDRLIFLEQEYLSGSGNRASWAQTLFLFYAQSSRLAFCGLSMSDTNIRRWMSAIEIERRVDKGLLAKGPIVNPENIWVRPKPKSVIEENIYLSSLLHLGIRPAWLDDWSQLQQALSNLTALPT